MVSALERGELLERIDRFFELRLLEIGPSLDEVGQVLVRGNSEELFRLGDGPVVISPQIEKLSHEDSSPERSGSSSRACLASWRASPSRPSAASSKAYQGRGSAFSGSVWIARRSCCSALAQAIERVLTGDRKARAERTAIQSRVDMLTPRERGVLALVVTGMLNKQIGSELGAGEKTIKVHRGRVMEKMEAQSVPDLVWMAARVGIRT